MVTSIPHICWWNVLVNISSIQVTCQIGMRSGSIIFSKSHSCSLQVLKVTCYTQSTIFNSFEKVPCGCFCFYFNLGCTVKKKTKHCLEYPKWVASHGQGVVRNAHWHLCSSLPTLPGKAPTVQFFVLFNEVQGPRGWHRCLRERSPNDRSQPQDLWLSCLTSVTVLTTVSVG